MVAPEALRRAGADVIVINASPDGYNINKNAGSTHPEQLQAMVKPPVPIWAWLSTVTPTVALP